MKYHNYKKAKRIPHLYVSISNDYINGEDRKTICIKYDITSTTLYKILNKLKITRRKERYIKSDAYGLWTVYINSKGHIKLVCKCGATKYYQGDNYKYYYYSCGCELDPNECTGEFKPRNISQNILYKKWAAMRDRCNNPNNSANEYYHAKGIRVCDEWENDFCNFRNWAINNGWKEGLTIERIDSAQNYEPSNCEWITQEENSSRVKRIKTQDAIKILEENKRLKELLQTHKIDYSHCIIYKN